MELPSKELLSAITNTTVVRVVNAGQREVEYNSAPDRMPRIVNIYELMHLMKKFATDNGFIIISTYEIEGGSSLVMNRFGKTMHNTDASTEVEAVFKDCEWILTQKENNEQA